MDAKEIRSNLLEEYYKLSAIIQSYDPYFLSIKAWGVTVSGAATWLLICALIDNLLFSHTESYEQIRRRRRCDAVNIAVRQRRSFPMAYQIRSDD